MSLMEQLITNTTPAPPKVIIYGRPGIGKSTLAAKAGALVVDCEDGLGLVQGAVRTPYRNSWTLIRSDIMELCSVELPPSVKAIAIDTLDWLVRRIEEYVVIDLGGKEATDPARLLGTLGRAHGGYFVARNMVTNIISVELLPALSHIASRGYPVILLAHAENVADITPEGTSEKRAGPDLPDYVRPLFTEWADAILYARWYGAERGVQCIENNIAVCKNRFGMEQDMPLDWPTLASAMYIENEKEQTNG